MIITASIVTHRTQPEELLRAIDCVLRCKDVKTIYIIDNSPTHSLQAVCSVPRVQYRHVTNNGYGAGHNIALHKALELKSDFHLVLNADTWWENDIISVMARYMTDNPRVGMMMPKVFYPDGDLQLTARRLPTPWDLFAKRFIPARLIKNRLDRYLLFHADHDKIIDSPYLLGSFLLFRCDTLRKEGLFDERFFMYPEDIDITRRIHRNWLSLYFPEVSIIHAHAAESRKSMRMLLIHIVNMIKYFNKWGWIFDSERGRMNRNLEKKLKLIPKGQRISPRRG